MPCIGALQPSDRPHPTIINLSTRRASAVKPVFGAELRRSDSMGPLAATLSASGTGMIYSFSLSLFFFFFNSVDHNE